MKDKLSHFAPGYSTKVPAVPTSPKKTDVAPVYLKVIELILNLITYYIFNVPSSIIVT